MPGLVGSDLPVRSDRTFAIRPLGPDDVELLRDLLRASGEAFDDAETYSSAQPSRAYLERLLRGDYFIGIAALEGDVVVGGLAAYELPKSEQERSEIYIYDLAVAAAYRRRGIATALIDELRPLAATRGAWVIFVQAYRGDEPAVALHTKLGAREDVLHFEIAPAGVRDVPSG